LLLRHDVPLLPATGCPDTPSSPGRERTGDRRQSRDPTTLLNGCGVDVGARLYARPSGEGDALGALPTRVEPASAFVR